MTRTSRRALGPRAGRECSWSPYKAGGRERELNERRLSPSSAVNYTLPVVHSPSLVLFLRDTRGESRGWFVSCHSLACA